MRFSHTWASNTRLGGRRWSGAGELGADSGEMLGSE